MRILVVEDDELLGSGLQTGLSHFGYAVDWVKDGEEALRYIKASEYALIVLDLGLPLKSGVEVLNTMRQENNTTSVLVLTARDAIDDKIAGLDAGADDYMIKPFDIDELAARIRALTRRQTGRSTTLLKHGNIELDPAAHTVHLNSTLIVTPGKEYSILETLLENTGKVVSKERLIEQLYTWDDELESNAIEVHIHHLRKKFGKSLIRTVRGVGYVIDKE